MTNPTPRYDGWTLDRKLGFLAGVAAGASIGAAAAAVGLSRTAAYALARRDPLFADTWAAALELAKPVALVAPLPFEAIEAIEALPTPALMHRLRRYNIGRGQRQPGGQP